VPSAISSGSRRRGPEAACRQALRGAFVEDQEQSFIPLLCEVEGQENPPSGRYRSCSRDRCRDRGDRRLFVHTAHYDTTFGDYLIGPFRYRNYRLIDVLQFEAAWWAQFGAAIGIGVLYLSPPR
jgi:hypothetical protein